MNKQSLLYIFFITYNNIKKITEIITIHYFFNNTHTHVYMHISK